MTKPILYGLSRSVYTRIVRLTLEEKKIDYTFEEVDIFGEAGVPPHYLKHHPFGRIPTLVYEEFTLYETGAITRYIDEVFPGISLQPRKTKPRARMNQIISLLDAYAYRPMIWPVFVQRVSIPEKGGTSNETEIAEALPAIKTCLEVLEMLLGNQPFFIGSQLTLADLYATPILLYFNHTPEGRQMLSTQAHLSRWLEKMQSRSSVEHTKSIYGC